MKLLATAANPIPKGAVVGRIVARDGAPLRVARWDARTSAPRGTVAIFQGRAEFIEKYFETIEELLELGFAVVAFDWRGQGGSERVLADPRKGHVGRFGLFARDVEAVTAQVLARGCPTPHLVLAHSMGAAIALDMARRGKLPAERLVCLAPMLGIVRVKRPRLAELATTAMTLIGLGGSYVPGGGETSFTTRPFAGNPLTSDPRRYARNADVAAALAGGAVGSPTIGWARGAFRLMRRLAEPRAALEIRIPTLVIAGGADTVVSTAATERFAARLKTGNALVVPGARHELLTEADAIRAPVMAAVTAFLCGATQTREEAAIEVPAAVGAAASQEAVRDRREDEREARRAADAISATRVVEEAGSSADGADPGASRDDGRGAGAQALPGVSRWTWPETTAAQTGPEAAETAEAADLLAAVPSDIAAVDEARHAASRFVARDLAAVASERAEGLDEANAASGADDRSEREDGTRAQAEVRDTDGAVGPATGGGDELDGAEEAGFHRVLDAAPARVAPPLAGATATDGADGAATVRAPRIAAPHASGSADAGSSDDGRRARASAALASGEAALVPSTIPEPVEATSADLASPARAEAGSDASGGPADVADSPAVAQTAARATSAASPEDDGDTAPERAEFDAAAAASARPATETADPPTRARPSGSQPSDERADPAAKPARVAHTTISLDALDEPTASSTDGDPVPAADPRDAASSTAVPAGSAAGPLRSRSAHPKPKPRKPAPTKPAPGSPAPPDPEPSIPALAGAEHPARPPASAPAADPTADPPAHTTDLAAEAPADAPSAPTSAAPAEPRAPSADEPSAMHAGALDAASPTDMPAPPAAPAEPRAPSADEPSAMPAAALDAASPTDMPAPSAAPAVPRAPSADDPPAMPAAALDAASPTYMPAASAARPAPTEPAPADPAPSDPTRARVFDTPSRSEATPAVELSRDVSQRALAASADPHSPASAAEEKGEAADAGAHPHPEPYLSLPPATDPFRPRALPSDGPSSDIRSADGEEPSLPRADAHAMFSGTGLRRSDPRP